MAEKPRTSALSGTSDLKICLDCPRRPHCTEICEKVENILPSISRGRVSGHRINASDLSPGLSRYEEAILLFKHKDKLSRRQRQVVKYFYQQGFTLDRIAEKLRISLKSVARHRARAIERLSEIMKDSNVNICNIENK